MEKYYDACGKFNTAVNIWIYGVSYPSFSREKVSTEGSAHERLIQRNPEIRKHLSGCVAKLYEADLEGQVGTVEVLPSPDEVLDFNADQTSGLIRDLMKRYFISETDSAFNFNNCLQFGGEQ